MTPDTIAKHLLAGERFGIKIRRGIITGSTIVDELCPVCGQDHNQDDSDYSFKIVDVCELKHREVMICPNTGVEVYARFR